MTGERDGPPMLTSLPIGDVLSEIFGTLGALAAAYLRDARGGRGQRVDASLYEPILQFLINGVPQFARTGKADRRSGSRIPGAVPRNTYRTRDGQWLALSAVTEQTPLDLDSARAREIRLNGLEARSRGGALLGSRETLGLRSHLGVLELVDAYESAGNQIYRLSEAVSEGYVELGARVG